MQSPDLQRIKHIRDYCLAIGETIRRYGDSLEIYASDPDYQRSVSFFHPVNRRVERRPVR